MNGRRAVIGLTVLCALVMSAVLASGASAKITAVTCAPTSSAKFKDPHCLTAQAGGTGFHHVNFHQEPTPLGGSNEKTAAETTAAEPSVLEGTLSGIVTAVTCTKVGGTGSLTNEETEMSTSGKGTIEYSGCTVTKPAGRECIVEGGAVTTNELTATTKGLTAKEVQFVGAGTGKEFATIKIRKCKENKPPNENYPVIGSVKIPASGATLTSTIAATKLQNTLFFGGNASGIGGSLTIVNPESGNGFNLTETPIIE